jgi:hypothetical protein
MIEKIRFGRLVTVTKITKRVKNPYKPETWLCKCDCGNEKIVTETFLNTSPKASCGCYEYKTKRSYDREDYFEVIKNKIKENIDIDVNECWIWQGSKHRQGYGSLRYKRKYSLVHRIAWEVYIGDIPKGMKVCHKCDMTSCCNPKHLFLGTQKDNVKDGANKGRYDNRKLGKRRNKLIFEQVEEIKKLNSHGMTRKELQLKFEVGQTCIAKILNGVSWKTNWTKEL